MTALARHYAIALRCEARQHLRNMKVVDRDERQQMVDKRNSGMPIDDIAREHCVSSNTLGGIFQWAVNNGIKVRRFRKGTAVLETGDP